MTRLALASSLLLAACGSGGSDDVALGPPLVRQVFAHERVGDAVAPQLAYGDHPDVPPTDDRTVIDAVADYNEIRIVLSEPIETDALTTIACADGTFDSTGGPAEPCNGVGILDENEDGVPDARGLEEGAVRVLCDGLDRGTGGAGPGGSPYDPTGSQTYEPAAGADSLGPAIVIETGYLGAANECVVDIDDRVTNADGRPICAPFHGDCQFEGDTSAIVFLTEPCKIASSTPIDGAIGVDPNDVQVALELTSSLALAEAGGVTVTDSDGTVVSAVAEVADAEPAVLQIDLGDLRWLERYTVTVAAPCEASISFTTGPLSMIPEDRLDSLEP